MAQMQEYGIIDKPAPKAAAPEPVKSLSEVVKPPVAEGEIKYETNKEKKIQFN
jgi:hypothetical protein